MKCKIRKKAIIFCSLLIVCFIHQKIFSQNKIENDSIGLKFFYEKLHLMKNDSAQKVSIVHIGDSHIQADHFSGKVRQNLQIEFGNAGRGLIFPYRLAKTNGQESFKSSSNTDWQSKRCVFPDSLLPIGISGITINTTDSNAEIKIILSQDTLLDYGANQVTLFHEKGPSTFDFLIYDTLECIQVFINSNLMGEYPFTSKVEFDTPIKQFVIKSYKRDSLQSYAQIYGLLLENNSKGILYNTIGVNGAEYRHYNLAEKFNEQLPALKPALIIISLGTNDAYPKGFNASVLYQNIDTLVKSIQKYNPNTNILLTTPPDSFRGRGKKKQKNTDMKIARDTIVDYCIKNNLAYWDLYEIMGGFGSIEKWKAKGLARPDKLHFSKAGYEIQAELLYRALSNGFKSFELNGYK